MHTLSSTHTCKYCTAMPPLEHPLYVYLARDRRIPDAKLTNAYVYIGISRHPFHRLVYNQNRKAGWKVGSKATKPIAPHWCLELILGPFHGRAGLDFKAGWRKGARRFKRRVCYGITQAFKSGINVYCRDKNLIKELVDYSFWNVDRVWRECRYERTQSSPNGDLRNDRAGFGVDQDCEICGGSLEEGSDHG